MGLEVTAYGNVTLIEDMDDLDAYDEAWVTIFVDGNKDFKEQFEGLHRGVYSFERHMDFCAGSYRGYKEWRANLCRLIHGVEPFVIWEAPEQWQDAPFHYLINFSDCEGYIGPIASARLATDFAVYQGRVDIYDDPVAWYFREKYTCWRRAFELAAQNGFVEFH